MTGVRCPEAGSQPVAFGLLQFWQGGTEVELILVTLVLGLEQEDRRRLEIGDACVGDADHLGAGADIDWLRLQTQLSGVPGSIIMSTRQQLSATSRHHTCEIDAGMVLPSGRYSTMPPPAVKKATPFSALRKIGKSSRRTVNSRSS